MQWRKIRTALSSPASYRPLSPRAGQAEYHLCVVCEMIQRTVFACALRDKVLALAWHAWQAGRLTFHILVESTGTVSARKSRVFTGAESPNTAIRTSRFAGETLVHAGHARQASRLARRVLVKSFGARLAQKC
jgi:hypothetical protein